MVRILICMLTGGKKANKVFVGCRVKVAELSLLSVFFELLSRYVYIVQCTVTITLMRGKDFDSFKCLYRNGLSIHDAQAHAYGRISVVLLP